MAETVREMLHEEKRELALGIFNGSVFTSEQVVPQDRHLISQIFYVVLLMSDEQRAAMEARNPAVLWEYMSNAHPTAINGYPMFPSFRTLTAEEWTDVRAMVLRMTEMAKSL